MELLEFLAAVAATVLAWRAAARFYRAKGWNGLLSHVGGFAAGLLAFVGVMATIVTLDPKPGTQPTPATPAAAAPPAVTPPPVAAKPAEPAPLAKASPPETIQEDKEVFKTQVREFEKTLSGFEAVSALALENAKAMANRLGKGGNLIDLYQALSEAQRFAKAGAELTSQAHIPEGLPKAVTDQLRLAKDAYWQMFIDRSQALEAFKNFLDTQKPGDGAKFQHESRAATLKAADAVLAMMKAKQVAGFTEEEMVADLKSAAGKPSVPDQKAKPQRKRQTD